MTSNSPVCYANIPSGTPGVLIPKDTPLFNLRALVRSALTIEEAADYTGIGRNTLRRLVDWEKSRSCGLGVSP